MPHKGEICKSNPTYNEQLQQKNDATWSFFVNWEADDLPVDEVVTAIGQVGVQDTAEKLQIPLLYLVDSAGARIMDQLEMFPGRRGAGELCNGPKNICYYS